MSPVSASGARTDPGLAPTSDGRPLLQARLGLYGKVLILINLGYWPGFLVIWALERTAGFGPALRHVVSPEVLSLNVVYGAIAMAGRLRAPSARTLAAVDVAGSAAIGVVFAFIMRTHPGQVTAVYENLLALVCVLAVRALIVPSLPRRTLVVGVLMSLSTIVAVVVTGTRFAGGLGSGTLIALAVSWAAVAIAFSTVASAVLYGLRREVSDARRLGQYTLEAKLGEGGMGVVYQARHAMLRRPTAIKLLSRPDAADVERFEREVQALAGLNHPNTVTIHDYGRTADGTFYYAMERLDGLDLEKLVKLDGPQPAGRVIHILRQAARGLAGAHALGLIHRDVKPANIFLCRLWGDPDAVKVLDFGLAKDLAATVSREATGAHALIGTPLYIAPESLTGQPTPDARSDLYSLGAVGYYLLTGVPVFSADTALAVCAHHIHTAPLPPSERRPGVRVPADLEAIVLRCLAKAPEARFAGALELGDALAACADAGRWSPADAAGWWARHGAELERVNRDPLTDAAADTVEIDPASRTAL